MYHKKTLIPILAVMLVSLIGWINHISKDNHSKIFCAETNHRFAFLLVDSDTIYDIVPNVNKKNINKKESIQHYVDSISSVNVYLPFDLPEKNIIHDFNLAVSEGYPEINYMSDKKMRYDISIDSKGKVYSNIFYPDEKKGGYTFVLDENDRKILNKLVNSIYIQNLLNNHFVNSHYNIASIIINNKVINCQIFSNRNLSAIIMFANYITMKYIANLKPNSLKFNIPSSKYTQLSPPPPPTLEMKQ